MSFKTWSAAQGKSVKKPADGKTAGVQSAAEPHGVPEKQATQGSPLRKP